MAMDTGVAILTAAAVAGPQSPAEAPVLFPATVEIMPVLFTILIRPLLTSAIYIFPAASNFTSVGAFILDVVAATPSVPAPPVPVPATVEMKPVVASTLRIRLLPISAMYTLFSASTYTPLGLFISVVLANTPSAR